MRRGGCIEQLETARVRKNGGLTERLVLWRGEFCRWERMEEGADDVGYAGPGDKTGLRPVCLFLRPSRRTIRRK